MRYRLFFFICSFVSVACVEAQNTKPKASLSLYSSVFNGGGLAKVAMAGSSAEYNLAGACRVGATYSIPLTKNLYAEAGLEFLHQRIEQVARPGLYYWMISSVMMPLPPTIYSYHHIDLLSAPVYLRLDIFKYFFITGGIAMDLQLQNDVASSQTGLGVLVGFGAKYPVGKNISLFVHPFAQVHDIAPFHTEQKDMLFSSGLKLGAAMRF